MKKPIPILVSLAFLILGGCARSTKQVPLRRVTKEQRERYLEQGGLNGSELNGEIMNDAGEYDDCVATIVSTLETFGKLGLNRDCPYYVDRYAQADYFPCVEVKGVEFVPLDLIKHLHADVAQMPPKYRIDVCNAMGFWNDDFNVFVEHDVVYWYADDATAATIGLLNLSSISP